MRSTDLENFIQNNNQVSVKHSQKQIKNKINDKRNLTQICLFLLKLLINTWVSTVRFKAGEA